MRILAIDQGTTSTRGIVFEKDGRETLVYQERHEQRYPSPGYVEHDPEELIARLKAAIEAGSAKGALTGIGIANQGESCLAWDARTKRPLSPVVVWQDERTASVVSRLRAERVEDDVRAICGLPLDVYFSATKLAWLYEHTPDARDLHRDGRLRLGTTDAFFLDRLTGQCRTDPSTASRTALMDLDRQCWSPRLCEIFGVPIEALPAIGDTTGTLGTVDRDGERIPVAASICDQQAAVYGHGCREPGEGKITFGTGAFALAVASRDAIGALPDGVLPTLAWRKTGEEPVYAVEGSVHSASSAVNWARSTGLAEGPLTLFDDADLPAAAGRGIFFVPALSGLATPYWDGNARGAFFGLSLDTTQAAITQAILEGVAFRTGQVIEALGSCLEPTIPLSIDGGMASNAYFRQFLSDLTGRAIVLPKSREMTAFGVAQLVAGAEGRSLPQPGIEARFEPRRSISDLSERFRNAVESVRFFADS